MWGVSPSLDWYFEKSDASRIIKKEKQRITSFHRSNEYVLSVRFRFIRLIGQTEMRKPSFKNVRILSSQF